MLQPSPKLSKRYSSAAGAAKLIGIICLLLWASLGVAADGQKPEPDVNRAFAGQTAGGETRGVSQAEIRELKQGPVFERELAGGERHTYRIALASGQYLKVVVEQKGIDVVVKLVGADGRKITEVDNDPAVGMESVAVVAEAVGDYVVEVRSQNRDVALGRYGIKIEGLREATPADRLYVAAQKVCEEGNQLRDEQAAESLQKAIQKYEEALPLWRAVGDKKGEAYTLNKIGYVYARLSEPKKALEYYNQALLLWPAVGDRLNEATTLINIGMSYWRVGESQKALDYYAQALPLERAVGNHEGEASTLNNIGTAYASLSQLQAALRHFNQALPPARAIGDRRIQAVALSNIGVIHLQLGELQKSLESFSRLLPLRREMGDRRGEAVTLHNLGRVYAELGELQKALEYYQQALPLRQAVGDRQNEAVTLQALSSASQRLDKWQEALEYSVKALALSRTVGDRRMEAYELNDIGKIYKRLGEPNKALGQFDQSLSLARVVGDKQVEIHILNNLADSYITRGDTDKALEYYHQALQLSRDIGSQLDEAAVLYGIARAQVKLGDPAQARTQIRAAIEIIESTRAKVASQQLRASFLASNQNFYELYIDLLMQMHKAQPAAGHAAAALQISERSRARGLLDILIEAHADIRQGVDAALLEREQSLRQQLGVKSEQLTRLLGGKHTEEQESAARKAVEALLGEYQEVEAQIRAKSPRYAALTQPQPLSLREIQQLLDDDTLLLEYALGEERSYLWAAGASEVNGYELPARAELENRARQVYDLLTARNRFVKFEAPDERRARIAKAEAEYYRAAGSLSEVLLGPVAAKLPGKRLLIVSDGALQYLPFAALRAPTVSQAKNKGPSPANGHRPLIVDREVISLPSASVLGVLRRELTGRQPAPKTVAVLADPVFNNNDERVTQAKTTLKSGRARPSDEVLESELIRSIRDLGRADVSEITRLPFTRREAEVILGLTAEAEHFKALDFEANRAAATNPELSQYRIIHFGTHGLLNSTHPGLSGLILSLVDKQGNEQNGFLSAQEVFNLKLPAELVVLSSCQTGLGKEMKGEGLINLTRAFMHAGAARVVVSLWEVNDQSTAELMKRFYQGILGAERLSPAAALRAAQISLWRTGRWHSPYYWAAFTLQGEPR